ncbi:MAG TPA: Gfo/Idh/MocA family oxidoreductase [Acidobacteriota bacterium]|nr:Gfo/Idh/MocA family oxidoreductase [Acidobacteriota bacterium]
MKMKRSYVLSVVLCLAVFVAALAADPNTPPLRAGMIGLDTSHVPAFARLFNEAPAGSELGGIRVVVGYPGGTDIPASRDRVGKFTQMLRDMGVEIVDTIPDLLARVDVVLLESVDGRIHLEEAIPVIKAGKPLFIDKPLAGSLADAIIIREMAKKHKVPWFSSSSYRVTGSIQDLRKNSEIGEIVGAATWGPCSYQPGIPDMFFYGIHGIEALFTMMGPGCQTVARTQTPDTDLLVGVWKGDRVGTYRGIRKNKASFGAVAYGSLGIAQAERGSGLSGYEALCHAIARFFKTGVTPVTPEETLELFAFMEAADESKRQGGCAVSVEAVMAKAQAEAKARMERQ